MGKHEHGWKNYMTSKFRVLLRGVPKTTPQENRQLLGIDNIAAEPELVGGVNLSTVELEYQVGKIATLIINDLTNHAILNAVRPRLLEGVAGLILVFDPATPGTWDLLRSNYEELAEKWRDLPSLVIASHHGASGTDLSELGLDDPVIRSYIDDNELIFCEGNAAESGIPDEIFAEFVRRVVATERFLPFEGEEEEEEEEEEELEESLPEMPKKAAPKPAAKPASKPSPKPAAKPASKPAPKPAVKPAPVPEEVTPAASGEQTRWTCPKCGNNNARMIREIEDKSVLLNAYPPIYGKKLKCGKCGTEWRKS